MSGAFSRRSYFVLASLCLAVGACGSDSPAPPTPVAPTPTTTAVQVRASGDASGTLEAGQTRQLVATATQSTGATSDVTQQATWQSSAPGVATVASTGLVTAVAQGDAEISATYQSVRGTMGVGVRPVPCPCPSPPRPPRSVPSAARAACRYWWARRRAGGARAATRPGCRSRSNRRPRAAGSSATRRPPTARPIHAPPTSSSPLPPARPRCTRSRSIAPRAAAT